MEKLPNDLDECLDMMEKDIAARDEAKWLEKSEDDAMLAAHHGFGTFLRNSWKLWDDTTELSKFFRSIGIVHGDDKSSIILISYHRKRNGKHIDLEGQLKHYWKHWIKTARELTPPNIDGVDEKYLDLFNEMNNESKD